MVAATKAWTIILNWCHRHFIDISPTKTVTINYNGPPLIYKQTIIRNKDSHRYLGINLSSTGLTFYQYTTAKLQQATQLLTRLKPLLNHLLPSSKLTVFKTFVRSRLDYALLLSNFYSSAADRISLVSQFQALTKTATLWITHNLRFPPHLNDNFRFLRLSVGLESFYDRINGLTASLSLSPPIWIPLEAPIPHPFHISLQQNQIREAYIAYAEVAHHHGRPAPFKTWYKKRWITTQSTHYPILNTLRREYPTGSLEILRLPSHHLIQESLNGIL